MKSSKQYKKIKEKNNIKLSLKKHLKEFGLKFFKSDINYYKWPLLKKKYILKI